MEMDYTQLEAKIGLFTLKQLESYGALLLCVSAGCLYRCIGKLQVFSLDLNEKASCQRNYNCPGEY